MKEKVLITGSSGFIGLQLSNLLETKNEFDILKVSRKKIKENQKTIPNNSYGLSKKKV